MLAKIPGVRGGHSKSSSQSTLSQSQQQSSTTDTFTVQKEPITIQIPQNTDSSPITPTSDLPLTPPLPPPRKKNKVIAKPSKESKRVEVKKARKPKGPNPKQLNKQAMTTMIENKPFGIARPKVWCEVHRYSVISGHQANFPRRDKSYARAFHILDRFTLGTTLMMVTCTVILLMVALLKETISMDML